MSWLRFFRRKQWDEERKRELESYLEMETAENLERGLSPADARYAALKKLVEQEGRWDDLVRAIGRVLRPSSEER